MAMTSPAEGIKVVDKTIRVVTLLALHNEGCTLAELAELTGFPRSTVQRIVEALRKQNWVTIDGGIRLGHGLLALLPPDDHSVLDVIHAHAERLWLKSGETVTTARLIGKEIFFMKKWISPQELRFVPVRSGGFPANCMSNGKVLLALKSDEELFRLFDKGLPTMTSVSIELMSEFLNEIAEVRKRGFSVDNEEYVQGISSFSVAIPVTPHFSLAITLSSPVSRFNARREELRHMLLAMRDTIMSNTEIWT